MMAVVAGLLLGTGIFLMVYGLSFQSSKLARRLATVTGIVEEEKREFGSLAHKLELAGIKVAPSQAQNVYRVILGGAALAGFITASFLRLPFLAALVCGAIFAFGVRSYVEGRIANYRRQIEKEIPQALTELAAMTQIYGSAQEMLKRAAESLGPKSLLARHFLTYSTMLSQRGPDAWGEIIENAATLNQTLAVVMHSLLRFSQRGGAGFAEAFVRMAETISSTMAAREDARARGQSALNAVRIIAGIMLVLITFLAVDPVYRPAVLSLPGQMAIALAIGMMVVGYWYCTDKINSIY